MANTLTGLELWEPKVRIAVEAEGSAKSLGCLARGRSHNWEQSVQVKERVRPAPSRASWGPQSHRALPSPHSGHFLEIWGLTFKVKADLSLNRIHSQLLRESSFFHFTFIFLSS